MATLTYGPDSTTVTIEDRALAHLQYVIFQRFRRHEPFVMTIVTNEDGKRTRRSTWMTPGSPVSFSYDDESSHTLDRAWLEELMKQSYSGTGLVYAEPVDSVDEDEAASEVVAAAGAIVDAAAGSASGRRQRVAA